MRYGFAISAIALITTGMLMTIARTGESKESESQGKRLRHIVLYKFKEQVTPAQIEEVVSTFAALKGKIDTIIGFEHGTNVSTEGKSEGFTHCFVVTFRSQADLNAYLQHPAHLDYVKVVRDRREKVVVFDYWAAE